MDIACDEVKFWIVGKVNPGNYKEWEFSGVFNSEQKAMAACVDEWYFIGPAVLNGTLPHGSVDWPGSYYPVAEEKLAATGSK